MGHFVQDNSKNLIWATDTISTLFTDTNKYKRHVAERNRLTGRLQALWMIRLCMLCNWASLWRMTWVQKERDSHWPAHSKIHLPESGRQHISLDLCPGHGRSALGSPAHCSQKESENKPVSVWKHIGGMNISMVTSSVSTSPMQTLRMDVPRQKHSSVSKWTVIDKSMYQGVHMHKNRMWNNHEHPQRNQHAKRKSTD